MPLFFASFRCICGNSQILFCLFFWSHGITRYIPASIVWSARFGRRFLEVCQTGRHKQAGTTVETQKINSIYLEKHQNFQLHESLASSQSVSLPFYKCSYCNARQMQVKYISAVSVVSSLCLAVASVTHVR